MGQHVAASQTATCLETRHCLGYFCTQSLGWLSGPNTKVSPKLGKQPVAVHLTRCERVTHDKLCHALRFKHCLFARGRKMVGGYKERRLAKTRGCVQCSLDEPVFRHGLSSPLFEHVWTQLMRSVLKHAAVVTCAGSGLGSELGRP